MNTDVQIIEKNGKPEWAVIPYDHYEALLKTHEYFDDDKLLQKAIERNEGIEQLPHEVLLKLIQGENPIKVWRQYRNKTMEELALEVGVSQPYLSQLENNQRQASQKTIKALAKNLKVDIQDLITESVC